MIATYAKEYAALLREHIEKKDTILYPLAERVLPEEIRPDMPQAYARAEGGTPGLRERYQRMAAEYETASGA